MHQRHTPELFFGANDDGAGYIDADALFLAAECADDSDAYALDLDALDAAAGDDE